jgi:hypothetical protein
MSRRVVMANTDLHDLAGGGGGGSFEHAPAIGTRPVANGEGARPVSLACDPQKNRFPFSIVWGPLPLITWILPFIGHLGICDSAGRVHDFAGPYFIGVNDFMTGAVHKFYQFSLDELHKLPAVVKGGGNIAEEWDKAIAEGDEEYQQQMHNLCCNNCHHHVARCLSLLGLDYTMFQAWLLVTLRGRYVSWGRFFATYAPFLIACAIVLVAVFAR